MFDDFPKNTQTIASVGTTYSDVLSLSEVGASMIESLLKVTALTGADTTLTIIPQYSFDKDEWVDQDSESQFTLVNASTSLPYTQKLQLGFTAQYFRYKFVVAGATPSVTFSLWTVAKSNGTIWDKLKTGFTSIVSSVVGFLNTIPYGVYNASPSTRTEGQKGPVQTDDKGGIWVYLGKKIFGENEAGRMMVSMPGTRTRITTATTASPSAAKCVLKRIVVKAALTGTVTFYDNPSAASGDILDVLPIGFPVGSHELNYSASLGVTSVTTAADNITIVTEPN